jgi:hypothetical protein
MPEQIDADLSAPIELPGEPERSMPPKYPKRRFRGAGKKLLIIILLLIVLGALGYGGWKILGNKKDAKKPAATSSATVPAKPATSDVPDETNNKKFTSSTLGVTLNYPSTWTVSENASGIRIESQTFTYKTTDKGDVSGNFRLYIRKGARDTDSKYIGRGVAIAPSQKLTYTQPLPGQRTDTLISNFGLDDTTNFAYFMIAGNFQLNKGDSLGPTYGKESETFIIAGGYSSKDLTDDLATNKVTASTYSQNNSYKQAIEIIKTLQLQ